MACPYGFALTQVTTRTVNALNSNRPNISPPGTVDVVPKVGTPVVGVAHAVNGTAIGAEGEGVSPELAAGRVAHVGGEVVLN